MSFLKYLNPFRPYMQVGRDVVQTGKNIKSIVQEGVEAYRRMPETYSQPLPPELSKRARVIADECERFEFLCEAQGIDQKEVLDRADEQSRDQAIFQGLMMAAALSWLAEVMFYGGGMAAVAIESMTAFLFVVFSLCHLKSTLYKAQLGARRLYSLGSFFREASWFRLLVFSWELQ